MSYKYIYTLWLYNYVLGLDGYTSRGNKLYKTTYDVSLTILPYDLDFRDGGINYVVARGNKFLHDTVTCLDHTKWIGFKEGGFCI